MVNFWKNIKEKSFIVHDWARCLLIPKRVIWFFLIPQWCSCSKKKENVEVGDRQLLRFK